MEHTTNDHQPPSIKDQLVSRFLSARSVLGSSWRRQLSAADSYFATEAGGRDMEAAAEAVNNGERRGQVDRIKRVVLALEKLAGVPHAPIL